MKFYEFTVSKMVYLDINVHKTIVEEKKFIMSQSMFFFKKTHLLGSEFLGAQ